MTLHFLNDVADDTESKTYVIITSLKGETTCQLINIIPGSRLLISSLPASASRTHVQSLGSLAIQQAFSKPLVTLISKDTNLVSIYQLHVPLILTALLHVDLITVA